MAPEMQVQPQTIVVGEWYRIGEGSPFEVVAVDADQGTVEIQHYDGTVEEVDFDAWMDMAAQPAPPPEDWNGALDCEREDYGMDPERLGADSWESPLDQLDRLG